ncbi:MAG: type II toxin-antitoxin system RatA family toxin [Alphaproteobacteria bacterium]|nr:type II toxin-antitoxin system RatA family toxin [Alphaproteobacteria bacterium]
MPDHKEIRVLPYRPDQIFDLVADIESYPDFLPWCIAARNRKRETCETGEIVWSDLVVGFKLVRERFTSKVSLIPAKGDEPSRIDVEYVDGPLKFLRNHWVFLPQEDGKCEVDFFVEFEFRSKLLEKMIGVLFHEAVTRMVGAFEKRADVLYGPK